MTARWVDPLGGFPGGFARLAADAVTSATPLAKAALGTGIPKLGVTFRKHLGVSAKRAASSS